MLFELRIEFLELSMPYWLPISVDSDGKRHLAGYINPNIIDFGNATNYYLFLSLFRKILYRLHFHSSSNKMYDSNWSVDEEEKSNRMNNSPTYI